MHDCLTTLHGSAVALVTPFRDGRVDAAALARLCERQIERGTAALVVCGSTGEAAAMSPAEQADAVGIAVRIAGDRVPVIAGCTASATEQAVVLAAGAAAAGARALLCAAPPYVKPTQDGICAHVRAVSHGADLPIMLYDVPGRVGVGIADDTIAALFRRGTISALKDATADLARVPRLHALCGETLVQMTGDDATAPAYRAMGGSGCVSVTANVTPALCASLHAAWDAGDLVRFAALRDLLDPLHSALFAESNPIPVKAALSELRLCSGDIRLPLTRATQGTIARLTQLLPELMHAEEKAIPRRRYALVG